MRHARFKGLRFHKRIRLLPGLTANVSLSGVGWSIGRKGFHAGVTARGQKYVSAGIPGTGLSVRQYAPSVHRQPAIRSTSQPAFSHGVWIAFLVLAVLLAIAGAAGK
jgi:hypothetical protein